MGFGQTLKGGPRLNCEPRLMKSVWMWGPTFAAAGVRLEATAEDTED